MSGMMMHGLGDCTPERNCGCMAKSPRDVLRKRIARALWAKDGQLPQWDKVPPSEGYRLHYYLETADAVIAALGLVEIIDDVSAPGRVWRRYVTPWERIEEDG